MEKWAKVRVHEARPCKNFLQPKQLLYEFWENKFMPYKMQTSYKFIKLNVYIKALNAAGAPLLRFLAKGRFGKKEIKNSSL
jgi:hypothetical protein